MIRVLPIIALTSLIGTAASAQGEIYLPGNGVTPPVVVHEVKPDYTEAAKAARIQGDVWLKCVVQTDGDVGDVQVSRSLDKEFGLDNEAVKAAKQWKFKPGTKDGKPVAVQVTLEMTFTLK
jgi:TonB family protein